jgi:hypothetical protein
LTWLEHPLWLLALPLALRFLPWRRQESSGWTWRLDLPILLAVVGLSSLLQIAWLARFQLADFAWPTSDFGDYCMAVGAVAQDRMDAFPNWRPVTPALLPAALVPSRGVLGALATTARVSAVVSTLGVYLWARGLHGRLAGVAAALLMGAVYPLLYMTKMVSFYPQATAVYTLMMGLLAMTLRTRHWSLFLATGLSIGLCQLMGLRGLLWALPALGLGLAVAVWPPWPQVPLRLALLLLPIWGSFELGPYAYPPRARSLESQLDVTKILRDGGIEVSRPQRASTSYIWGRTPLTGIPGTLKTLSQEGSFIPEDARESDQLVQARAQHVQPWLWPLGGALLAVLWGLRRRPDLLLVTLGSCLPFAVSLAGAAKLQAWHLRFVAQSCTFIPLLLGMGFASLAGQEPEPLWGERTERGPWGREAWAWAAAPCALLLLWVLGMLPSFLGPQASWKPSLQEHPSGARTLACTVLQARGQSPSRCSNLLIHDTCVGYLAEDAELDRDPVARQIADQAALSPP